LIDKSESCFIVSILREKDSFKIFLEVSQKIRKRVNAPGGEFITSESHLMVLLSLFLSFMFGCTLVRIEINRSSAIDSTFCKDQAIGKLFIIIIIIIGTVLSCFLSCCGIKHKLKTEEAADFLTKFGNARINIFPAIVFN